MKKNAKDKDKSKTGTKQGKGVREIVPAQYENIQESLQINTPAAGEKIFNPEMKPKDVWEEWPADEEINQFSEENYQPIKEPKKEEEKEEDKKEENKEENKEGEAAPKEEEPIEEIKEEDLFSDPNPEKIFLPLPFYKDFLYEEIKWSRPYSYVNENILLDNISKTYPNKNKFKFRTKVKEYFEKNKEKEKKRKEREAKGEEESSSGDEDSELKEQKKDEDLIYRDFFQYVGQHAILKIINFSEREETDEELNERIAKEEENLERLKKEYSKAKNKKDPNLINPNSIEINRNKLKISIPNPSGISFKDGYPECFRWLASIYQLILDRNLTDVNTNETIFQKIYPQKNGVPMISKTGKYWVKLYSFGKYRKVEIDDKMPLTKYDHFYLPKCETLDELWPAILTKALLKFFSYKVVSNSFYNFGDFETLYALTGYIPQNIKFENDLYKVYMTEELNKQIKLFKKSNDEDEIEKDYLFLLNSLLTDKNYLDRNCILLCYKGKSSIGENQSTLDPDEKKKEEQTKEEGKEEETMPPQKVFKEYKEKENATSNLIRNFNNESQVAMSTGTFKRGVMRRSTISNPTMIKKKMEQINLKMGKFFSPSKPAGRYDDERKNSFRKISSKELGKMATSVTKSRADMEKEMLKYLAAREEKLKELYLDKVPVGILYNTIDYFDNGNFNMNRLYPIDFQDLRDMVKQLNEHYNYKTLPKDEKKIYVEKLKEVKEQQRLLKAKRLEELKVCGDPFHYIKIGNSSIKDTSEIHKVDFSYEQIKMAKKCLLNEWKFPPMEYLDEVYAGIVAERKRKEEEERKRKEEEEMKNRTKKEREREKERRKKAQEEEKKEDKDWSKHCYLDLIENNTEIYSQRNQEIIQRIDGTWIKPKDFFTCFDNFSLLYNPNNFLHSLEWDNIWYDTNDIFTVDKEKKIIRIFIGEETVTKTPLSGTDSKAETKGKFSKTKEKEPEVEPPKEEPKPTEPKKDYLIILYLANQDSKQNFKDQQFGIHVKFFAKDNPQNVKNYSLISYFNSLCINNLSPKNEYFLWFNGGVIPFGFYSKFLSDYNMEFLSYSKFFVNYKNYFKKTFKVEHPVLQKNIPYLLLRIKISTKELTKFFIVSESKDNFAIKYTKIALNEIGDEDFMKNDFLSFENEFDVHDGNYILTVSITPPYNFSEEEYDIHVFYKPESMNNTVKDGEEKETISEENPENQIITLIEPVSPCEIAENYIHNKHYILFQEFIFSSESVFSFINIRIRNKKPEGNEDMGNTKSAIKGGKNSVKNVLPEGDSGKGEAEVPIEHKIRLNLELYDPSEKLLFKTDFFNSYTFENIVFEGKTLPEQSKNAKAPAKDKKKNEKEETESQEEQNPNPPYKMICYFDQTELPPDFSENNNYIQWVITSYNSETLAFVKDTSKDDRERKLIESWELNEPGRAEKAKASRKRYLLERKKQQGEMLSKEEEEFLSTPRERKFQKKEEEEEEKNAKKDTKAKKTEKKAAEPVKVELKKYDINFDKKIEGVDGHSSLYIKNFLNYANNSRMVTFASEMDQMDKQLNTEEVKNNKETEISSVFDQSCHLRTDTKYDTKYKESLKTSALQIQEKYLEKRKKGEAKIQSALRRREVIKSDLGLRQQSEQRLQEIISEIKGDEAENTKGKGNKFDLDGLMKEYKEIIEKKFELPSEDAARIALSEKLEESIQNEIKKIGKGKEKDFKTKAENYLTEIQKWNWKISDKLISQLKGF
ncbi:MAG: C2 family cysteine protease [archaeon]|nr:C2 family cysteine protease [archaeon]